MAVRSRRLFTPFTTTAAATYQQVYDVPDGRTARFSLVVVSNNTGAAMQLNVGLGVPALAVNLFQELVPAFTTREILRGMVMDPDDRLYLYAATNGGGSISGFGSLLLGAPA